MAWTPFLLLIMQAYFPDSIWDGDSEGRNSDDGSSSAPDWRDWTQNLFEMIAVQDYILNQNIELGTRLITFGPTPEASLSYASNVVEFDLALSGANDFRVGDGTNYANIGSTGIMTFAGTGYLSMNTMPIYFGPTPEASLTYAASILELNLAESGTNDFRIGDGTNFVQFASNGAMTLAGTAKRKLTMQIHPDAFDTIAHSKPTQVEVGLFKGYSMPIYSADNEELFYELRVPYRWDGVSDPQVCLMVALADAEDLNDTFKMQCSWESVTEDGVLSAASHDVEIEKTILTAHTAQYSVYSVHFTLPHDVHTPTLMAVNDILGMRIRRIASSGTEIDNEIIIFNAIIEFNIDKIFGTWVRP